jgi:glutamate racemase
MTRNLPIGVFDSGIGGLTVLSELLAVLPRESFLYLGDTARLPYGTKSPETIVRYALTAAHFLASKGMKLLVVACNTASATALPALRASLPVPVIGVVEAAARAAAQRAQKAVGIIGTESTVASGAYQKLLRQLRPDLEVHALACPLFVPLAEEGWFDHPISYEVAKIYLEPLRSKGVDTVVLACTHYPLLARPIAQALGPEVQLVNSGKETALEVAQLLQQEGLEATGPRRVELLVTDAAPRVRRLAQAIVPGFGENLQWVDVTLLEAGRREDVATRHVAG